MNDKYVDSVAYCPMFYFYEYKHFAPTIYISLGYIFPFHQALCAKSFSGASYFQLKYGTVPISMEMLLEL